MNSDKAREYFSGYVEGGLEPGLAQAFERKLESDPDLSREFASFRSTFQMLGAIGAPVPEPPSDLHDRIAARVDLYVWEQKRKRPAALFVWSRRFAVGGLATLALVAALLQFQGSSGHAKATMLAPLGPGQLSVSYESEGLVLKYRSAGDQHVRISDASGRTLREVELSNETLHSVLKNQRRQSDAMKVEITGERDTWIALPGTRAESKPQGSGTLVGFAKAVAGHFRVPVVLQSKNTDTVITWQFKSADALESINAALEGMPYVVDRRSGVIFIESL